LKPWLVAAVVYANWVIDVSSDYLLCSAGVDFFVREMYWWLVLICFYDATFVGAA